MELNKVKDSPVKTQQSLESKEKSEGLAKSGAKAEQTTAAQPEVSKLNVMKVEQPTPEKKEAPNATIGIAQQPKYQKAVATKQEEPSKPSESQTSPFGLNTGGPGNETAAKPTEASVTEFDAPSARESAEEKLADLVKTGLTIENPDEEEAEVEPKLDGIASKLKKISRPIALTTAQKAEQAAELARLEAGEEEQ